MYNFEMFGNRLKSIRLSKGYSQLEVSQKAYMSIKTIRRLEKGKVTPTLSSLESLSIVYNIDLIAVLLEYRVSNYSELKKLILSLENDIIHNNLEGIFIKLDALRAFHSQTRNRFASKQIAQIEKAVIGILYMDIGLHDFSLMELESSLKLSFEDFEIFKYKEFIYNESDLYILMLISYILMLISWVFLKQKEYEKSLEMSNFTYQEIDYNSKFFPAISFLYGNSLFLVSEIKTASKIYRSGIKHSLEYNNLKYLSLLFFGLGKCKLRVGSHESNDFLIYASKLSELTGKSYLLEKVKKLMS